MLIIQNRFTKPTNKQLISLRKILAAKIPNQKKKKSFRKHQRSRVHFILFFLSLAHGTTNWTKTRKNPILFIAAQIWLPSAIITRKMKTKSRILISDQPNRVVCFFFSIDFKMLSDFERATIKIMAFSLHRALYKIKRDLIVALAISDGGDWRLTARIEPIQFFFFFWENCELARILIVNEILFPFCFFSIFIKIWNVF